MTRGWPLHRTMSAMESFAAAAERPTDAAPHDPGSRQKPALSDVAGLTVGAVVGALLLMIPLGYFVLPPILLPEPFPDHHQTAETLLFLLAFAVVVPTAVVFVPRLCDRIALHSPTALAGLSALGCAALVALLLAVKISSWLPWGDGLPTLLAGMAIWWGAVGAAGARAVRGVPPPALEAAGERREAIWLAAALLLLISVPAFAFADSISPIALVTALLIAAGATYACRNLELPTAGRWGRWIDGIAVLLLLLAVPNLVIVTPEVPSDAFLNQIVHFHQNFFLGPANHVLGGGAMLVGTLSQYGVASIDFIAGWFAIVGVSNGTLGLIDGILQAFVFAAGYVVVRAAGVGRISAIAGFTVAVVVLVLALVFPLGGLLQHGAIRFGMPMLVLVATAVELRWDRFATAARITAALTVGLSSIWALEAFGYTLFTFAAVVGAGAALRPAGERRGYMQRWGGAALASCLGAHLLFAATTLVTVGSLPEWNRYVATLYEFLVGGIGDLTYDFSAWSPGVAVGAMYLVSATGVALVIIRRRDLAIRERTAIVLLAGTTAYGIALFSYLVNRSADHIVPYVSLPAVMLVLIWLGLLFRTLPADERRIRTTATAVTLGASALLVSVAWSSVDLRFSQSALAHVIPGGQSLPSAIDRLRDLPPLSPAAPEAERLLDRYWQNEDEALVIAEPDLEVEALARTGRINVLPLSDPWEDSLVVDQRLEDLDEALADVEGGDRLLLDGRALEVFDTYRRDPGLDPLDVTGEQTVVPTGLAILQQYALYEIGQRFRLRILERGTDDLYVAELVPREG